MLEREQLAQELWSRLASVEGVKYTARNPKAEPGVENLPAIQFFELEDQIEQVSQRGGYPVYKRKLKVVLEAFIAATTEPSSSQELGAFIEKVKKALYGSGNSLSKTSTFTEEAGSRVLRPPTGNNTIGLGMVLKVQYIEDTGALFA